MLRRPADNRGVGSRQGRPRPNLPAPEAQGVKERQRRGLLPSAGGPGTQGVRGGPASPRSARTGLPGTAGPPLRVSRLRVR